MKFGKIVARNLVHILVRIELNVSVYYTEFEVNRPSLLRFLKIFKIVLKINEYNNCMTINSIYLLN